MQKDSENKTEKFTEFTKWAGIEMIPSNEFLTCNVKTSKYEKIILKIAHYGPDTEPDCL